MAAVSVLPCASSNAFTFVAFSSAFSFTDGGAVASLITDPPVAVMFAPATTMVEATKAATANAAKIPFEERMLPNLPVAHTSGSHPQATSGDHIGGLGKRPGG